MDPLIVLSIAAIWAALTIWLIVTLVMDRKHFQRIIDNRNREILEIAKDIRRWHNTKPNPHSHWPQFPLKDTP